MKKLLSGVGKTKRKKGAEENVKITPRKLRSQKNDASKVKRQALADKTNSGSENNRSSSSTSVSPCVRPKRARVLPARLEDHELNLSKQNKKNKCVLSSTPIEKRKNENASKRLVILTDKRNTIKPRRKRRTESVSDSAVESDTKQNNVAVNNVDKSTRTPPMKVKQAQTEKTRHKTASSSFPTPKVVSYRIFKQNRPAPVSKDKLLLLNESDIKRDDQYEFCLDPNEKPMKGKRKPRAIKKITFKKEAPRKKKLTAISEATMKYLSNNIEKEKNANLFRELKLRSARKKANNGNACENFANPQIQPPTIESNKKESLQITSHQNAIVVHDNLGLDEKTPLVSPVVANSPDLFSADDFIFEECNEELAVPSTSRNSTRVNQKFFEVPLASSSMIKCVDNNRPSGSPWRVDLDLDKPKRSTNFYVKPSMTPAYERDTFYILGLDKKHTSDLKKKHNNCSDIIEKSVPKRASASVLFADDGIEIQENGTKLKQSSLLSFFKESFSKPNKRGRKSKKNSLTHSSDEFLSENTSSEHTSSLNEQDKNANQTAVDFFGFEEDFDDIENENIPLVNTKVPKLNKKNIHQSTPCKKQVLVERNKYVKAPTRITQKEIKNVKEMKNKIIPLLNEANISVADEEKANSSVNISSDSENSVVENHTGSTSQESSIGKEAGLFEDPKEVADACDKLLRSFTEPPRKMYERKKRPPRKFKEIEKFIESYNSESENDENYVFSIKSGKVKKTKKKQHHNPLTKEEAKQMNNWAAGFNSMLEEVEEFPLCVE